MSEYIILKISEICTYIQLFRFNRIYYIQMRLRVLFKKPQMTYKQSFEVFILADMSAFCPHFFVKLKIFVY